MKSSATTLLLALMLTLSCSSRELTRGKATALINKDKRFATTELIAFQQAGRIRGATKQDAAFVEGLFIKPTGQGFDWLAYSQQILGAEKLTPTQKGLQYWKADDSLVTPAQRQVVDVTGITNSVVVQGLKEVSFTWKYKDLPAVVARYTGQGKQPHTGKVLARLYDDGWRIEELELTETGREPFHWSSEFTAEADRQQDEVVKAAQQRAAAAAERQRMVEAAKKPTKTLGNYTSFRDVAYNVPANVHVDDASVVVVADGRDSILGYWQNVEITVEQGLDSRAVSCWRLHFNCTASVCYAPNLEDRNRDRLENIAAQVREAQSAWKTKFPDVR